MIKCSCQLLHFIRKFEPSGRGQRLFHPWSGRKRRAVADSCTSPSHHQLHFKHVLSSDVAGVCQLLDQWT